MKHNYTTEKLLLSLQKSLLGYIRPDLRAVRLTNDRDITIRFVLDHVPSLDDKGFYSEALLDFVSDLPINVSVRINEEYVFSSEPIHQMLANDKSVLVYLRYEANS